MRPSAIFDDFGRFYGHRDRQCGVHRTLGPRKAWCQDCGEWCFPVSPCTGCARLLHHPREGEPT